MHIEQYSFNHRNHYPLYHHYFTTFQVVEDKLKFINIHYPNSADYFHYDDIPILIKELEKVDVEDVICLPEIVNLDVRNDIFLVKLDDNAFKYLRCYKHGIELSGIGNRLELKYIPCFILNLKFLCRLLGNHAKTTTNFI